MPDLKGMRILVAGGTGDVGAGVVAVFLAQGADVIVPSRSAEKTAQLRQGLDATDHLTVLPGEVGSVAGAVEVARAVRAIGPLDGVVASLGGWWLGSPLIDVDATTWDAMLASNLTSHFATAKAFVPLLKEKGGTYVQFLGAAAEFPVPGSSLVSITAAAVAMLGRTLRGETGQSSVRVRQIMIESLVATRARTVGDPAWVTAAEIGALASQMIAGRMAGEDLVRMRARAS